MVWFITDTTDTYHFATDSICTTRKINLKSAKLGEFSHENEANDVFFLQNGLYRFNSKWKLRGLGRLGTKQIEHLDTFEKDGKLFYKFKVTRANRLRQSILSNKLSEIGKITEKTREVNLNADKKRFWLESLTGINHKMNRSLPLSLNHITKEEIWKNSSEWGNGMLRVPASLVLFSS